MPGRTCTVALTALFLAALAVGCNGGDTDAGATATEAPTSSSASPTPTTPVDIRQVDLPSEPAVAEFLGTTGGAVDADRILYADLTGDGNDEAVVPVSSGGEGGDFAVFVIGYVDGRLEELLLAQPAETSITAAIENGQLVTTEGVLAPGDPFGVPSQVLNRYYAWNGEALVVEREEQVPAR
ncbi:MAG: hypothetical protein IIC90_03045 [Chloroflexi bacterium]|nr:hypothetical protein [Chloroflexota bacterium]